MFVARVYVHRAQMLNLVCSSLSFCVSFVCSFLPRFSVTLADAPTCLFLFMCTCLFSAMYAGLRNESHSSV